MMFTLDTANFWTNFNDDRDSQNGEKCGQGCANRFVNEGCLVFKHMR